MFQFECFSEMAHCQFKIAGLPQLESTDNLLAIEMGPLFIRDSGEFKTIIEHATGLEINLYIPSSRFPCFYDSVTPGQLLDGLKADTPIRIDYRNYTIDEPSLIRWWQSVKDFLRI